jgi:uncharacterized protein YhaN
VAVHIWVNKYRIPLPHSDVISEAKPGQQIAKCITEIQAQIDAIQAQIDAIQAQIDALEGGLPDASGVATFKVLQSYYGEAVWDWARFV